MADEARRTSGSGTQNFGGFNAAAKFWVPQQELSAKLTEGENKNSKLLLHRDRSCPRQWRAGQTPAPAHQCPGIILQKPTAFGAAAFFVAAGMRWLLSWLTKYHAAPFTLDLVGAMVVAFLGAWLGRAWEELSRDLIIVGGLMPLVPGVAITNALRDLLAGDLMSGAARILEAALTAVAVAMGVILVLALPMRMGG